MANSLLDFVMSLVRDPDAAARYAADPAQALADADLANVTGADVQNLIPVVSESLSMTSPVSGVDDVGGEAVSNVWASGAATAAFDAFAFADQVPELVGRGVIDTPTVVTDLIDADSGLKTPGLETLTGTDLIDLTEPLQLDAPVIDDVIEDTAVTDAGLTDDWAPLAADPHPADPTPGFDLLD